MTVAGSHGSNKLPKRASSPASDQKEKEHMQPGAPHLPSDMRDALAPESGHTRRSALIFLLITVMIDSIGIGVIVPVLPTLVPR